MEQDDLLKTLGVGNRKFETLGLKRHVNQEKRKSGIPKADLPKIYDVYSESEPDSP